MFEGLDFLIYSQPPEISSGSFILKRSQHPKKSYKQYGNSREYFPLIKKADYFSVHLKGLIKDFFNNSPAQFASFFANETEMNAEELNELRDLVDKKIASEKHKT